MSEVKCLGFEINESQVYYLNQKKQDGMKNWLVPTSSQEVDKFLYTMLYMRKFIPERAEHARTMKEAITKNPECFL
jgi:membrane protease subunit (stomatin/prohibitin family)